MFKNRWANLAVILVLILLVAPAAYVYGLYVGETHMAKVFPDVERLGYRYGAIESIANTPLVGGVLAKGQCDGLRSAERRCETGAPMGWGERRLSDVQFDPGNSQGLQQSVGHRNRCCGATRVHRTLPDRIDLVLRLAGLG